MKVRSRYPAGLCALLLGGAALCIGAIGSAGGAGEVRGPKSESQKKSEDRNPKSKTSYLFSSGSIPRIRIELAASAVESLRTQPREFVEAKVSEGAVNYPRVAVHLKGKTGSFRTVDDKPNFTLDFSLFNSDSRFHGLRRIHLNNSVEDPSFANEKLGSELFQAAGLPAPRVTRALVELNGRALGLYVLKEGFTEDFLALHFRTVGGDLYEPADGHDVNEHLKRNSVKAPFDEERRALKSLALAAEASDPARRWQRLNNSLDTKQFIAFMAMEIMLGHRDGYCLARNNFRVYHDLGSGKMVFFPQGMDQLLGTADLPWQPSLAGLVAQATMTTPEGKQAYAAAFASLLTNVFKVETLTNRVDQLAEELRPVLTRGEWVKVRNASAEVKERIAERKASLLAQLQRPVLTPMVFSEGVGRPQAWEISALPADGRIDQAELDGRPALHIATKAATVAAWRARALIPRGSYRFEGRVRIAGVKPLPSGLHQGAGLRISGGVREETSFTGDSDWRPLGAGFQVTKPAEEVELICELRALAGEAWFDVGSLRVLRMDNL